MPPADPSPTTLRLLACVESFAHEEAGAVGNDDWPGLVSVLNRELLLLQRLALEKPADSPTLKTRLETLSRRYDHLAQQIEEAKIRDIQEIAALIETRNRLHAVRQSYLKR